MHGTKENPYGKRKRHKPYQGCACGEEADQQMVGRTIGKDPATVSKWCTNTSQPGLETLLEIARVLDVDIKELLNSTRDDVQLVRIQKQ